MKKEITIIGAGISGLAAAHWLEKDHPDSIVLEKGAAPGGTMQTEIQDDYLFDHGPNSGLETTPLIRKLAEESGISSEMIYAREKAKKRYILRDNTLHALPTSPGSFLKTRLFSSKAKLRLLCEPFVSKFKAASAEDDESIADFVRRRLGQEFLDYAINPFVGGVFAGNPENLSVKSAFPRLYRLEEKYGGLIKGMIKGRKERKKSAEDSKQSAKMFSFRQGMHSLPRAVAHSLGEKVVFGAEVNTVEHNEKENPGYLVKYKRDGEEYTIETKVVVSTIPAYIAADILSGIDKNVSEHLSSIYYPPVLVLCLGYRKDAVGRNLDGFGFLIPEKEKKLFLGAIWNTVLFPERSDENHVSFTLFIGGARSPGLLNEKENDARENLIQEVLKEFHDVMEINETPVFMAQKFWEKAIPQYNTGHFEHDREFDKFEESNPGLFLAGNYRGGISVGDCIKNSDAVYRKVTEFLSN